MINTIIKYSLTNRMIIVVGSILLLISGIYISSSIEVDVFPDLNAPTVVVITEAHGMAPEEVERLVTFPIETAVNGASNIRRVRSSSAMGFSLVWVEFDWGMDIYDARQIVSEKLTEITENFPAGVDNPVLAPQSSLLGEIMIFSISSDSVSAMDLRTYADWTIRPRLLSVKGVAQVAVQGGDIKEYQVMADPHKMKYYQVTFPELIAACEENNTNASGGVINQYGNEYIVRGIMRTSDTEKLGQTIIKHIDKYPVNIADVADIKIGGAPRIGTGSFNGKNAVVLTVTKQPNTNTIELTRDIDETIKEIETKLPENVDLNTGIFKQSDFIQTAINNVIHALFEGAIFVIFILFLFLMNYRTTIISLLAIPLSLIVSIITLKSLGFTINTMSLGGMAIAIGSIVDDAIIDVENVYKRLKENREQIKNGVKKPLPIIYEASKEIRASILNATLIIIVSFIPLFFLSGMEGKMLKPLGISFIVSLFASLIVAITITPVLCSYLLVSPKQLKKHEQGSWLSRNLTTWYGRSLEKALKKKKLLHSTALLMFLFSVALFFTFGRSFLPPFNEGSLAVNVATLPGISLDESDKIGKQAEEQLLSLPEVNITSRKTGRAELAEHSFGANVSEIEVPFRLKDNSRAVFLASVREKLSTIPGVIFSIGQPISHRIDHLLSGSQTNIAIKLFGTDLKKMYDLATDIQYNILEIEGIVDLNVEQQVEIPQLQIKPKREMLAKYGISLADFARNIKYGFGGKIVGEVFENEKTFDMVVRFNEENRKNIETIGDLLIDTGDSNKIPLRYVAEIISSTGPNTITRENVQRKIVISANVAERDLRSVVNDIRKTIDDKITLPQNYRVEYGGQFESEAKASRILFITSLMAMLVVFLILFQEFKSAAVAGVILLNLPLALIGGVVAIALGSNIISIPSIIGFISLFGIATRNGILLVSRYRNLQENGLNLYDTILAGSKDRLTPILMTALTAALALIPLALSGDKPGNEIQSPMAIVILGGLLSSTLLNMYVIPVVFYVINQKKK
ncbi:MAG: efflux RND transporter permease subunit [Bacteroidales bacterium]|nr:efflux RND transporter permease subunit [Bacteroidales bacterium]